MKCKHCNGTGRRMEESDNGIGWISVECEYCNGTGEVEQTNEECSMCHGTKEILTATGKSPCPKCYLYDISHEHTNEEWMKSLDTEDFAEAIFAFMDAVSKNISGEEITNKEKIKREVVIRWLKEKHDDLS